MEQLAVFVYATIYFALTAAALNRESPLDNSIGPPKRAPKHPEWLDVLRELIFKTISPSPSMNNDLYKSLLEAPYYGSDNPGGVAAAAAEDSSPDLVARGDVYHFPSRRRWIICEEGCDRCDECFSSGNSSLRWTLSRARAKDEGPGNSSSLSLQLIAVPRPEDGFHMRNLRRSHVYLTASMRGPGPRRGPRATNSTGPGQAGRKRSVKAAGAAGAERRPKEPEPPRPPADSPGGDREPPGAKRKDKRRQTARGLQIVPIRLDRAEAGAEAPGRRERSRGSASPGGKRALANGPNYYKLLDRLSLLFGERSGPDRGSFSAELEQLYRIYENFLDYPGAGAVEGDFNKRSPRSEAFEKKMARPSNLTSDKRKLIAIPMTNASIKTERASEPLKKKKKTRGPESSIDSMQKIFPTGSKATSRLGEKIKPQRLRILQNLSTQKEMDQDLVSLSEQSHRSRMRRF